jgi:hypothetical protein
VASLTPDERTELEGLLSQLRDFKERVYETRPHLRLPWETARRAQQAQNISTVAPAPVPDEVVPAEAEVDSVTSESPSGDTPEVLTDDDDVVLL